MEFLSALKSEWMIALPLGTKFDEMNYFIHHCDINKIPRGIGWLMVVSHGGFTDKYIYAECHDEAEMVALIEYAKTLGLAHYHCMMNKDMRDEKTYKVIVNDTPCCDYIAARHVGTSIRILMFPTIEDRALYHLEA